MLISNSRMLCAFAYLIVGGCQSQRLEENFFNKERGTRLERLRQYSLEDQYRIFRYGSDVIEPPVLELADPIAERGAEAVPFLRSKLSARTDDLTVRDILSIFESMQASKSFNVKSETSLMKMLTSKVLHIENREWKIVCLEILERIKKDARP
jgi:hypothetical protein